MIKERFNVTYLFGAGASAKALPIVGEIPGKLEEFLEVMKKSEYTLHETDKVDNIQVDISKKVAQHELFDAINWLIKETQRHASIDTLAKKLYVRREFDSLILLKAVLTCFFIYEQVTRNADSRYDSFFAALIDGNKSYDNLPYNLKILSWNYDFQFEKAFSEYSKDGHLHNNQSLLRVSPSDSHLTNFKKNFGIFKLNGTTSLYQPGWRSVKTIIDELSIDMNIGLAEELVRTYLLIKVHHQEFRPMLKFAWEHDDKSNELIENAMEATNETQVLVVIGYSFPYFNREIDRKIIQSMENLQTVYFQAQGDVAKTYIESFRAIRNDVDDLNTTALLNADQFFLPPEL